MTIRPLDAESSVAPYEQLRVQIATRAASGDLEAGTRLPPVRVLAEELGVAPGTVARAYKELEADGVVVTEGRRGTSIAAATAPTDAVEAAADFAASARRLGLTLAEATRLLESRWVAGPVGTVGGDQ